MLIARSPVWCCRKHFQSLQFSALAAFLQHLLVEAELRLHSAELQWSCAKFSNCGSLPEDALFRPHKPLQDMAVSVLVCNSVLDCVENELENSHL